MRDCMASGSFAMGKEEKAASDSMVFVSNINQSVDVLLKTSSLFESFPPEMGTDTAFLDRMHCYIPGWEIPKFRRARSRMRFIRRITRRWRSEKKWYHKGNGPGRTDISGPLWHVEGV